MAAEYNSFDEMGLREEILRGVYGYGFEHPSAIQKRAIVPMIAGGDIIAQSQSGTGKTGTFTIALLQRLDWSLEVCQGLVVAPTRELAKQIYGVFEGISSGQVGLELMIGGTRRSFSRTSPQVVIGTPGRICDNVVNRRLDLGELRCLVIDEADELLSRGFQDQIRTIFQYISRDTQLALFSATLPTEIVDLTTEFMRDPTEILLKRDELTLEGIKQYYVDVEDEDMKFGCLCDLYGVLKVSQVIVYCNSREKVERLAEAMRRDNFTVSFLTSNLSQEERNAVMQEFRDGSSKVLISTDIIARGIDVQQVSTVINYDLPLSRETYIHRIGRSGRFGRKGTAINFITRRDRDLISDLESFYATSITPLPCEF